MLRGEQLGKAAGVEARRPARQLCGKLVGGWDEADGSGDAGKGPGSGNVI